MDASQAVALDGHSVPRTSIRFLVLVAVVVGLWTAPAIAVRASRNAHTTGDEPFYLITAISIGEDLDLDVADEREDERYRDFHEIGMLNQETIREDGSRVSPHDPGLPALLALPMRVGGWVAAKATLAGLAGLLAAVMVWVAERRFSVPSRVALVTVLAFSASAPLAVYGTQVYPELPAALLTATLIGTVTGPLDRKGLVLTGLAIVALPWLSVKYAPIGVMFTAIAVVRLWRTGRARAAAMFVAWLGLSGIVFLVTHYAWYGGATPYASGSFYADGQLEVVGRNPDIWGRSVRLVGLLADRHFGLAAWQPAFALGVPALTALVFRRPAGWTALAVPFVVGWLEATYVALTMHGWWFPGRQVVVVVPCVVVAVGWWTARRPGVRWILGAMGLVGASVYAWLALQGIIGDLTLVVTFEEISHPVVRAWRLLLPDYRRLDAAEWGRHGAWIAVAVLLAWIGYAGERRRAVDENPSKARPSKIG